MTGAHPHEPRHGLDAMERSAIALYEIALANGVVNELRHWNERVGKDGDWEWRIPALPDKEKNKWRKITADFLAPRAVELVDEAR